MHLNYIEIHGFKSFPDKTRITFDTGVTAIVGPNGSGKSNISDAVRWVLGEQSTKSLRGGKMEEVIFSGTQLRNAMGFASVTISLDNSDKRVADAGDELLVSRRYYRSGDSEYLINGTTVRLRDVRELFLDTGLGRDGYSIIGQGRIAEVVSAKSTERREIFEEAAGIAKYRFRKNDADRQLQATLANLERISDILNELGARVGPLETQAKKAREALSLAESKKGLEITLFCDELRRKAENIRGQTDRIAIARQDYDRLNAKLAEIRNSLEHNSELLRGNSVKIDDNNAAITELSERAAGYRNEISVLTNDIEHNLSQAARLDGEKAAYGSERRSAEDSAAEIRSRLDGKNADLAAQDEAISALAAELQQLIIDNETTDRQRLATASEIAELTAKITNYRVDAVADKSIIESNNSRCAAIESSLCAQQTKKQEYDGRLSEVRKKQSELEDSIADAQNRRDGFARKQADRKAQFDALKSKQNELNFACDEANHRIKLLRDLDKSMDGFADSVKQVIAAKNSRELAGIIGTVASLMSIESGCELAVETALAGALQNIVVSGERDAKAAMAFLKSGRKGRATFLPLDTIKPRPFDGSITARSGGVVDIASKLVDCDERYRPVAEFLLGRIVVVEDIDTASAVARKLNYRYRIVTLDGQMVNAGGSYTGGFVSRSGGVFSRRVEIEAQQSKLAALETEKGELEVKVKERYAELQGLEAEITALGSDLVNLGGEKIRLDTQLEQFIRENSDWQLAYDELCSEKQRLEEDTAARLASTDAVGGLLESAQRELNELNAKAERQSESGDDYISARSLMQENLSKLKIKRTELQKDIESLTLTLDNIGARSDNTARIVAGIENQKRLLLEENDKKNAEIERLTGLEAAVKNEIEFKKEEIEEGIRTRMLKEHENTSLRASENGVIDDRDRVSGEIGRLETLLENLESERERARTQLWEVYELTPPEAEKQCVPFENITSLRNQVADLNRRIKALGNVNFGAIDEYAEVSERYTFLKAQYEDADNSRRELINLIKQITDEMRVMFAQSFTEINKNFKRVFFELFGGGNARLYLSDENDVLESGIEMDVQPPGKVIKNMSSLSGGESSLVAIALYFAILAVNPSPFCVLDEIDSALDDSNVVRFADYLKKIMDKTQFIAITHRRGTMESADVIYGVTMQESGVSKLLKMDIDKVGVDLVN